MYSKLFKIFGVVSDMAFNVLEWKTKKLVSLILVLLVFYMAFVHKKIHHVTFEGTIKNVKPETVWEFVADFSNMKILNPSMYVVFFIFN